MSVKNYTQCLPWSNLVNKYCLLTCILLILIGNMQKFLFAFSLQQVSFYSMMRQTGYVTNKQVTVNLKEIYACVLSLSFNKYQ